MPHSELHKKKLKQNLFILGLIFFFIAVIWAVTMIKMVKPSDKVTEAQEQTQNTISHQCDNPFQKTRESHQSQTEKTMDDYQKVKSSPWPEPSFFEKDRAAHQQNIEKRPQEWWGKYKSNCPT